MMHLTAGAGLIALGLAVVAQNGSAGIPGDNQCVAGTYYSYADDEIKCPDVVCDDPDNNDCLKRTDTIFMGEIVEVTFCSCHPLQLTETPTGLCHIYELWRPSQATYLCSSGHCPLLTSCQFDVGPNGVTLICSCY